MEKVVLVLCLMTIGVAVAHPANSILDKVSSEFVFTQTASDIEKNDAGFLQFVLSVNVRMSFHEPVKHFVETKQMYIVQLQEVQHSH